MEPKLKDGQTRKVDPEEAIDTMARRGRLANPERFKKPDTSVEGRIDHSTTLSRYASETKEMGEDFKRKYSEGVRKRSR